MAIFNRTGRQEGFSSNLYQFDKGLRKHLKDMGVTAQFVGRDTMRTFVNSIVKFSFPETKKKGNAVIERDLEKVFASMDNPDVLAFFNHTFGDGTASARGKVKSKSARSQARKRLPDVRFNWQGDLGQMKQWHESRRKAGKVSWKDRTVATIGNWKFGNQMYVPSTAYNKFERQKKKNLGKYKAGWANAAEYFARVTGGRLVLPAFVKKQPIRKGTYKDNFKKDGNGYATATNLVGYASKMTRYVIKRAELTTEGYLFNMTKAQARKLAERFNRMRIEGAL